MSQRFVLLATRSPPLSLPMWSEAGVLAPPADGASVAKTDSWDVVCLRSPWPIVNHKISAGANIAYANIEIWIFESQNVAYVNIKIGLI